MSRDAQITNGCFSCFEVCSFVIRILGAVLEDPSEFDVVKLAVFDRSLFVQVIHFVLSESIAQCC